jgi:group I intron endonuclease
MLQEYKERPTDFTRQIIAEGTYVEMVKLETTILKSDNAGKNPNYYNRHTNNGKFYNLKHTEETKEKMSTLKVGKPLINSRGPRRHFAGQGNHFYGKTHSAETRKIMSEKAKKRSIGAGNNNAKSIEINNVLYHTMNEAAKSLNISMHIIRKMLKEGNARRIK